MDIKNNFPQYVAEFIGTFFLVFLACGSVILLETIPAYNSTYIPFVFGGVVSVLIYAVGHISGAHFNPAVTVAFWSTGRFPSQRVPFYIFFQTLGAVIASSIHSIIFTGGHSFGATALHVSINTPMGYLIEVILSFLLMFVIISVATDSRAIGELAGIAIGSTVAICAMVGGPLTGASMNPARSIGPALFQGNLEHLHLYLIGPVMGAILGAKTYEWIRCQRENQDADTHGCC